MASTGSLPHIRHHIFSLFYLSVPHSVSVLQQGLWGYPGVGGIDVASCPSTGNDSCLHYCVMCLTTRWVAPVTLLFLVLGGGPNNHSTQQLGYLLISVFTQCTEHGRYYITYACGDRWRFILWCWRPAAEAPPISFYGAEDQPIEAPPISELHWASLRCCPSNPGPALTPDTSTIRLLEL